MALFERKALVRHFFRWLGAVGVTIAMTAILLLLRVNGTASGMIYLVLVVWFGTKAGPKLSFFIALISSILFDYYFLAPFRSFTISGVQGWVAMVGFILSSFVVGRIAERARRQTQQADQRRADVERVYALSQEMMLHQDPGGLVRDIPQLVERIFALNGVLLYIREQDQLYSSMPGVSVELRLALGAIPATQDESPELPEGYSAMSLVFGMKSVGMLAWRPATLSLEVATSVASQVAIALTRSLAIETAVRLEAARSGDRLRNALIDSLTHELRTPLTAIRAAATTLLDGHGLDMETRNELASIVDEESARLDVLIGKAMEMAEIDAEGIMVHAVPLHTRTVLEQALEESRVLLSAHRVVISVEGPDNPVWFDPHLLGRVLRHLLENAARYTSPGTRIVLRSRRAEGKVEFMVEDDGPGIDAYDLPLIFEKFYRGKRGTKGAKGSGMGLAIVRAILAAHGGSIAVESSAGRGTRFCLWIPEVERGPDAGA